MAQTTITQEGAFDYTVRSQVNANFTDLYGGRTVTAGDSLNAVSASGLSTLSSTNGTTFTLTAPTPGVSKYLECITATANVTVNTGSTAITIGTTFHNIVLTAADQAIHLLGETATRWVRVAQNSTLITTTT